MELRGIGINSCDKGLYRYILELMNNLLSIYIRGFMNYRSAITLLGLTVSVASGQTPDLKLNEVAYVSMKDIVPGQMRYSQKNIDLKVQSVKKNKGIIIQNGQVALQHDGGKSAFSLKEAAPVMKIKDRAGNVKYVLKDAHHDTLANRAFAQQAGIGDQATMPVRVKNDFSDMSYRNFWRHAYKNYLVDLIGVDGRSYLNRPPQSFDDMKDDPVRYFVTISARKGGNNQTIEESFGADFPLWYKRLAHAKNPEQYPGDILNAQMIENVVSQKLIDNGFTYDSAVDGESGSRFEAKVREAHAILSQPKNQIKGLRLVKQLGNFSDIKDQLKDLAQQPDPLLSK
jgi:hypothetical protein